MKLDQQEVVDHLWTTFLNTGRDTDERGYMLDSIPEKLRASWKQSCLKGTSVVSGALPYGIAAQSSTMTVASQMLALPVSPESARLLDRDRSISVATSSSNRALPHGTAARSSTMTAAKAMPIGGRSQSRPSSSSHRAG